jgi:hypothetical protein
MLSSIINGHDCLDDIDEEFRDNDGVEKFFRGKIPVSKTFGDYLRDFEDKNIEELNWFLNSMGHYIRGHLKSRLEKSFKPSEKPTFNVDSTVHEQHGSKIEGCAYNYNGVWCLNSEVVYDEMGIAYAGILLEGNAKPGVKGPELLDCVLSRLHDEKMKNPSYKVAHVNGDSAYAFEEFIKVCQKRHATFTIAARGNIPWEKEVENLKGDDWVEWKYSDKELLKYTKKNQEPPKRFMARWHWSPYWGPQLKFPILIKKEWKNDPEFPEAGAWHYHAVITNEDLHLNAYQEVYSRYLTRAHMENFIRDAKEGYDAYHMPCLDFKANHAYLLLLLIAQNILRWVSLLTKPDKPHFAKKLRRKFIFNPGKLTSHGRQIVLRVSEKFLKEVKNLTEAWGLEPEKIPLQYSSA